MKNVQGDGNQLATILYVNHHKQCGQENKYPANEHIGIPISYVNNHTKSRLAKKCLVNGHIRIL